VTARHRRWLNAAIVTGVVAVGVAALVSFLRDDEEPLATATPAAETEVETGPVDTGGALPGELPEIVVLPSELREEGGLLWWAGRCEASVLDASSGLVADVPGAACDIRPSPSGASAVASVDVERAPTRTGVVLVSRLRDEGSTLDRGEPIADTSTLATPSAWNPAGNRVAVCASHDGGFSVDVLDLAEGTRSSIRGFCLASFLDDGRLAVAHGPAEIALDGQAIFGDAQAELMLPDVPASDRYLTALGAAGDRLVVGLVSNQPTPAAAIAVVAPDGTIEFSTHLRPGTFPGAAGLAPDGRALWYVDGGGGPRSDAVILDVPGGRQLEPYNARWVSWSPSGDYLAAAVGHRIEVYSWPEGRQVAAIDAEADTVAWTLRPEQD
jgi:hypothetical protein